MPSPEPSNAMILAEMIYFLLAIDFNVKTPHTGVFFDARLEGFNPPPADMYFLFYKSCLLGRTNFHNANV